MVIDDIMADYEAIAALHDWDKWAANYTRLNQWRIKVAIYIALNVGNIDKLLAD